MTKKIDNPCATTRIQNPDVSSFQEIDLPWPGKATPKSALKKSCQRFTVHCVCVCVCVCCHPIYSGRQACGRTSQGHTEFLIHLTSAVLALIFIARRVQPGSFPSSTVKSNFVYLRINRSPLGHLSLFLFGVSTSPSSCDCTEIRTHVPTSEGFEVAN